MIGINLDNIDTLIKKNNNYLNSFNISKKGLLDSISNLNNCYSGSGLEYLFSYLLIEQKNIQTISRIIDNYSNILISVKKSYENQDRNLKTQVNRINSNL